MACYFIALAFLFLLPVSLRAEAPQTLRLNQEQVIELALTRGIGVQMAKLESDIAKTQVTAVKSLFDTVILAQGAHLIDRRDQAISVFGTDNRTTNWGVLISKTLPAGTQTELTWANTRNTTNSAFVTVNPYYENAVAFSVRQPLLEDFLGAQGRGRVAAAKKDFEAYDSQSKRRVLVEVYRVLANYWRWVMEAQNASVTEASLNEALKFARMADEKKRLGWYELTDVLASKASHLSMSDFALQARLARDNSRVRLLRDLNLDPDLQVSSSESLGKVGPTATREAILHSALARRSDYKAAQSALVARGIEVRMAKNKKFPALDAIAEIRSNGIHSSYRNALGEVSGVDHPSYLVGGEIRWELENRAARAGALQARYQRQKALLALQDTEALIREEVSQIWNEFHARREQVATRRRLEEAQREKWKEEQRKYELGRSSSDLLTRYQEDYLASRRYTLAALYHYRMAYLGLKLADESLLGEDALKGDPQP